MNVKLVSVTQPIMPMAPEDLIAYCARVSNPSNQNNIETAPRLLRYLIKHKHWSPFELVDVTMEIKTSRAIAAQILRHRSFSFQEFSQRYSTCTELEDIEWREQGKTNRQVGDMPIALDSDLEWVINHNLETTFELYNTLVKKGVAKECARMILPLSTQTTMYMKGSIRSWLGFFNVRLETVTQKEHRDIAVEAAKLIKENFPHTAEATNDFNNFEGGFM